MGRLSVVLAVEVQWAAPVHKYFLNEAQYARRARFDFSEDREMMRRCYLIVKAGTCRTPVRTTYGPKIEENEHVHTLCTRTQSTYVPASVLI